MRLPLLSAALTMMMAGPAPAQTAAPQRNHVRAFGEASVSVKPDLAKLSVAITTQAATAQEASSSNATKSTAVFTALEQTLGRAGELRTISFTVAPNYNYPRDGVAVLTGFTATNMVEVEVTDLNITGRVIDTAIGAGASRVDSLRLMLKDDQTARTQALRLAGQKARSRAEAIAAGLNVRIGALIAAEEGITYGIVNDNRTTSPTAVTTPVETGTLEVRAQITVQYEAMQ